MPRALLDTVGDEMRGVVFAQGAHGPMGGEGLKAGATCPPRGHGAEGQRELLGEGHGGVTSYRINRHVPGADDTA